MNRNPLWKNLLVAIAIVLGAIYTLPNFFGEAPAVQVSPVKATLKSDAALLSRVEEILKGAGIPSERVFLDTVGVKARFNDTDTQLKAKDLLNRALNPDEKDPSYIDIADLEPDFQGLKNSPVFQKLLKKKY